MNKIYFGLLMIIITINNSFAGIFLQTPPPPPPPTPFNGATYLADPEEVSIEFISGLLLISAISLIIIYFIKKSKLKNL